MTGYASVAPILKLDGISKRFGGVTAADDISLALAPGEIVGLIGPNGSGKTTLLNIISGIYAADSGTITFEGKDVTRLSVHRRAQLGIARTFQHPRLLERCDIYTNILVGIDLAAKTGRATREQSDAQMLRLLDAAGLRSVPLNQSIEKLSYGQQKLLEIVRAILPRPRLLLIDEPAAGLNEREMEHIVALVKLAVEDGIAVLLIEHSMDLIMSICDRITVLNFGHQIATGAPSQIQTDADVIKAYLGGEADADD